jgi:hypothetical protein
VLLALTTVCLRVLAKANASIEQNRCQTVMMVQDQQDKQDKLEAEQEDDSRQAQCGKVRGVVTAPGFDQLIMIAIGLNTLCLAIVHYNQPQTMSEVLDWLEYGFTAMFMCEAFLKIFGLGLREYFTNGSNIFDFIITMLSFVSLFDFGAGNVSSLRTLRVFRALRMTRILRRFPVVMRCAV